MFAGKPAPHSLRQLLFLLFIVLTEVVILPVSLENVYRLLNLEVGLLLESPGPCLLLPSFEILVPVGQVEEVLCCLGKEYPWLEV